MGNTKLQYAVRAVLAAAAASAVAPVYAQTAPAAANASDTALQEVVVTGSRLAISPNDVSISPITSLDSLDIQKSGLVRTEDLLNNLPSVVAEQSGGTSISSNGTATVSLRGLGSQRTMVLVNGTRLAPGAGLSAAGNNTSSSPDINQIPAELIERVDVLTGGASAVYGADAVAGVVNFVLNTHFEGVRVDANYGFGRYENNHADLLANLSAAGNPIPDSTVDAGFNKDVSILMGSNFADGKGNATVYATYLKTSPAVGYQYDYAGCSLNTPSVLPGPGGLSCGGSGTPATGRFAVYGSTVAGGAVKPVTPAGSYAIDPATGAFRPYSNATDSYNYGALSFLQRASERYTAGSFLNYDINESTSVYSDFMYARNSSEANYGPSGLFTYTGVTVSCANPLLSAQEVGILCAPATVAANQLAFPQNAGTNNINLYVGRRAVENGPREDNYLSNSFRETVGVKGKWIEGLTYDLYGQVGINTMHDSQAGYINATSGANALNVVTDPATGLPACAAALNGTAPTCVPWNIFAKGGVTQAAINFINVPATYSVTAKEYIVDGSVTADLEKMGMKLPTAASGPRFNLGAEYRSESYVLDPDFIFANGLNSGGNGAQSAINGGFHVSEVFTELGVPLVNDVPGIYTLELNAGYRYSSYTSGFNTNTYKFGVEYAPIKDVKIRAGYNRAVRAPSVGDLFSPAVIGAGGTADPCWGPVIGGTGGTTGTIQGHDFAYCARTGVTAAEWGNIATNPAAQINTSVGGNINLKPEKADTFTYGVVFQPTFVSNLVASLDFYYIRIQNTIESLTSNTIVNNCGQNDSGCDLIHRGAGTGSLWFNNNDFVTATEQNIGTISTKGIDLASHYSFDTGYGKVGIQLLGTRVLNFFIAPIAGGAAYNCAGYWGTTCNAPTPHWRHVLNTDWQAPWLGLDVSLRWRYIGPTQTDHASQDPQLSSTYYSGTAHIGGFSYLDMSLSMPIAATGIDLRVGVNNLTDKAPPIIPSGSYSECPNNSCNDNTWVGTYDTLGRYLYAHVQVKF
ncbi:MAG TPA: TonB-dependent receptor [Steroidobacteraceae bacterium]|nr:TonB-dependent receptor [Steroidobacteraceae bacterium]